MYGGVRGAGSYLTFPSTRFRGMLLFCVKQNSNISNSTNGPDCSRKLSGESLEMRGAVVKNKNRKYILILSIICVLGISFIPDIGFRIEDGYRFLGFPADWLGIYINGGFGFMWIGFLFNIAFFYLIFWLLINALIRLKNSDKNLKK